MNPGLRFTVCSFPVLHLVNLQTEDAPSPLARSCSCSGDSKNDLAWYCLAVRKLHVVIIHLFRLLSQLYDLDSSAVKSYGSNDTVSIQMLIGVLSLILLRLWFALHEMSFGWILPG